MNKTVSIVIPTFNRKKELLDTLKDLSMQEYPGFEVIVVDGGNETINKGEISGGLHVKTFHHKGKGSHDARNFGISKAGGELIIFIDDDVKIEDKNFIKNHVKNYEDSVTGGVAGREVQPKNTYKPEEVRKIGKINFITGRVIGDFNGLFRTEVDHAVGCNMSFRKSILNEVGGFDSIYDGTAYFEETDLCLKVKKKGYKIVFDPTASLTHLRVKRGGNREKDFYRWRYWYFHNYAILFCRHFNPIFRPLFFTSQSLWIIGSSLKRLDIKNLRICFSGLAKGYKAWKKTDK